MEATPGARLRAAVVALAPGAPAAAADPAAAAAAPAARRARGPLGRAAAAIHVQKLAGHSTLAVTERYLHLQDGYIQETISLLERAA